MSADDEKTKGNAAMAQRDFQAAVDHYTKAIELQPDNHILYSNRSAAYVSLNKYEEALADGEKTIALDPKFVKGYSRKGLALYKLNRIQEAMKCYQEGLKVEPNNAALLEAMREIQNSASNQGINMLAGMLNDPNVLTMIATDPELKEYLNQPDFMQMFNNIRTNPQLLNIHMQDQRLMKVITKILSQNLGQRSSPQSSPEPSQSTPASESHPEPQREEPKPQQSQQQQQQNVSAERKQALEQKELGNAAYKKKQFDQAIEHYNKAFELDSTDMTFLTNRAAANFEAARYEDCIRDCEEAIQVGRSNFASFELIAKAYARIGSAYHKLGDFQKAIDALNTSLTENRVRSVQLLLRKLEKEKEEADRKAYINPEIAQQEKEKGNEFFKNNEFPKAIAAYSEAIRRDPNCATLYSNRAAAYIKLAEFGCALKDCETCLELDPTFVKAYKRLASIHNFNKDYHKAMDAFKKALEYAPDDAELKAGLQKCLYDINSASSDPEQQRIRQQRAMADPEIQKIIKNPMMERLLANLGPNGDQQAAIRMLADPQLKADFDKLVASGAISMA